VLAREGEENPEISIPQRRLDLFENPRLCRNFGFG
jgi:hypothetical protein